MPSPRTDLHSVLPAWHVRWPTLDRGRTGVVARQLNVRLVLALGVVALVGLLVSGIAITQILPGFFIEQTQQRAGTAAASSGILLRQQIDRMAQTQPAIVNSANLRNELIVAPTAATAATFFNATVDIIDSRGQTVAHAEPPDREALERQGLRRDTEVESVDIAVPVDLADGRQTWYRIVVSEPYSAREQTMDQIRGALIGAGVLALIASFVTGVVAARTVTGPIRRLRGVAGRITQGQLDERVVPSGVPEIDELGAQFNMMADRLAQTLRMLEADRDRLREFVADVSHELRTPIAALRLYAELIRDGAVDEATRREFLQRSTEQVARLEWLSTNLLDLSRIDAGILPLDMRDGDLREPVQAVVQAMSEVAIARGVALDGEAPAAPVELRFDRERIVQLVTNLVGNALKFTPRGGSVSVRLQQSDDGAVLEVRDTGKGIPADELPRVFERFYRGTNTGDARASGSGLGLAIVRSIVDMHGGDVEVASVVGKGTLFRIELPRTRPQRAGDADKVNESLPPRERATNPAAIP